MKNSLNNAADPAAFVQQLNVHLLISRCLVLVTELRITEMLATGPRTAGSLATELGLHGDSLYRVLRLVASYGFFAEDEQGRYSATDAGALLQKGVKGTLWERLRLPWQELLWATYAKLPQAVRTGEPAFELAFGEPFFEHLAADPELNLIFDSSMARFSNAENPLVAAAYPFDRHERVVDVGGGQGGLLAEILKRHSRIHGVLFDQPQVVTTPNYLKSADLAGRWEVAAGTFFESVPRGAGVYTLKRILHDWSNEQAGTILRSVRAALPHGGRVLVIDAVLEAGNAPDPNKYMDVNMLALLRGRERSEREFRELFSSADLRLVRVIALPPPATVSIVEACAN